MTESTRTICTGCGRPPTVCFCDAIPTTKIHTTFDIYCVQHPHEARRKALSSVPLLQRSLERFELEVSSTPNIPIDLNNAVLLFPGANAKVLTPNMFKPRLTLIVVDGTWAEAKKIVNSSSVLQSIPRVLVDCKQASLYGSLRKEPVEGCVSTLEAIARAITVLENQQDTETQLLSSFQQVVEKQIAKVRIGVERSLQFYDGVPKPIHKKESATVRLPTSCNGEVYTHRFYLTHRTLETESRVYTEEFFRGTHSEAVAKCAEMNIGRIRGERYGIERFISNSSPDSQTEEVNIIHRDCDGQHKE